MSPRQMRRIPRSVICQENYIFFNFQVSWLNFWRLHCIDTFNCKLGNCTKTIIMITFNTLIISNQCFQNLLQEQICTFVINISLENNNFCNCLQREWLFTMMVKVKATFASINFHFLSRISFYFCSKLTLLHMDHLRAWGR